MCVITTHGQNTFTKYLNADKSMLEVEGKFEYDNPENTLTIDYQISNTVFVRILVAGLTQTVRMYNATDHIIPLSMDENEVILIPLNNELVSKMKPLVANTLAYHALKIVIHAYNPSLYSVLVSADCPRIVLIIRNR